ncbi:hypothetical protein [Nonomuraea rubra]|uniref:hypothetical protein n=1 Tax=Nonomuraea rubra TaxID=46180 RepID=UPI0033F143AA
MLILVQITSDLIIGRLLNRASNCPLAERPTDRVAGSCLVASFRHRSCHRKPPLYNGTDDQEHAAGNPPGDSVVVSKEPRCHIH